MILRRGADHEWSELSAIAVVNETVICAKPGFLIVVPPERAEGDNEEHSWKMYIRTWDDPSEELFCETKVLKLQVKDTIVYFLLENALEIWRVDFGSSPSGVKICDFVPAVNKDHILTFELDDCLDLLAYATTSGIFVIQDRQVVLRLLVTLPPDFRQLIFKNNFVIAGVGESILTYDLNGKKKKIPLFNETVPGGVRALRVGKLQSTQHKETDVLLIGTGTALCWVLSLVNGEILNTLSNQDCSEEMKITAVEMHIGRQVFAVGYQKGRSAFLVIFEIGNDPIVLDYDTPVVDILARSGANDDYFIVMTTNHADRVNLQEFSTDEVEVEDCSHRNPNPPFSPSKLIPDGNLFNLPPDNLDQPFGFVGRGDYPAKKSFLKPNVHNVDEPKHSVTREDSALKTPSTVYKSIPNSQTESYATRHSRTTENRESYLTPSFPTPRAVIPTPARRKVLVDPSPRAKVPIRDPRPASLLNGNERQLNPNLYPIVRRPKPVPRIWPADLHSPDPKFHDRNFLEPLLEAGQDSQITPPEPSKVTNMTPRREKYINPERAFKVIEDALEEQPTITESRWAQPTSNTNTNLLGTKAALLKAEVKQNPTREQVRERLRTKSEELGALHPREKILNEPAGGKVFSDLPAVEPSDTTIAKLRVKTKPKPAKKVKKSPEVYRSSAFRKRRRRRYEDDYLVDRDPIPFEHRPWLLRG